MKVTYFFEVFSSWCHWVEPVWSKLKQRYEGRVDFEWRIALMSPGDFPASREQCDWFYRRSGGTVMNAGYMLNSGWCEAPRIADYRVPDLVAEAARSLGAADDRVRIALADAALREGRKISDWKLAVAIAARAARLDSRRLRRVAESPAILRIVEASTAEFFAHRINQRPAFVLEDEIGDKAVFSGLVRLEPIAATIDAMVADVAAYASHRAHYGDPPAG